MYRAQPKAVRLGCGRLRPRCAGACSLRLTRLLRQPHATRLLLLARTSAPNRDCRRASLFRRWSRRWWSPENRACPLQLATVSYSFHRDTLGELPRAEHRSHGDHGDETGISETHLKESQPHRYNITSNSPMLPTVSYMLVFVVWLQRRSEAGAVHTLIHGSFKQNLKRTSRESELEAPQKCWRLQDKSGFIVVCPRPMNQMPPGSIEEKGSVKFRRPFKDFPPSHIVAKYDVNESESGTASFPTLPTRPFKHETV